MNIYVVQNPSSFGLNVPENGIVLWYGVASGLPSGWSLYTPSYDALVMCAAAGAKTTTPAGSLTHVHTNISPTGAGGAHDHDGGYGTIGGGSSDNAYGSGTNVASSDHTHSYGASVDNIAAHTHSFGSSNSASNLPAYKRLYWIKRDASVEYLPKGSIVLWTQPIADRPLGWSLCDGNIYSGYQTPDLRSKFIYGAATDSDVNASGGANSHTHTNPNTGNNSSHTHGVTINLGNAVGNATPSGVAGISVGAQSHNHSDEGVSGFAAGHNHSVGATGSSDNTPPYLKLYYMMRTS